MTTRIISNENDLNRYIEENGDHCTETSYIAMRSHDAGALEYKGDCFAIIGCTYASEAFRFVNDDFLLVISDEDSYNKKIEKQLNSESPSDFPFYLRKSDLREAIKNKSA